jgi:hypothetical protein
MSAGLRRVGGMQDFRQRFYDLEQFLSGFFHQDWKEVYDWQGETPSFEGAVRHFKSIATPAELQRATEQLRQFLSLPLSDQEIAETFDQIHLAYNPRARGLNERGWLEAILKILTDDSASTPSPRFIG